MRKQVFISYAEKDRKIADRVCEKLEESDIPCWIAPRDIPPGHDFAESVIKAIPEAEIMVVIISSHSNNSVHVQAEVNHAFSKQRRIIPFRIEDIRPSDTMQYYLAHAQWLDAFPRLKHVHLNKLVSVIKDSLESPTPPPDQPISVTKKSLEPDTLPPPIKSWLMKAGISFAVLALIVIGIFIYRKNIEEKERVELIKMKTYEMQSAAKMVINDSVINSTEWQVADDLLNKGIKEFDKNNFDVANDYWQQASTLYSKAIIQYVKSRIQDREIPFDEMKLMLRAFYQLPNHQRENSDVQELAKKIRSFLTITNSIGMKFVYIPRGHFMMGSTKQYYRGKKKCKDERYHDRTIEAGFYLGVHEVTRGQFAQFIKETNYRTDAEKKGFARIRTDSMEPWQNVEFSPDPEAVYSWKQPNFKQADDHPVTLITWNDACAFISWLKKRDGHDYRLPTEAEWEYACRAGTDTPFYTGKKITPEDANLCWNKNNTCPPGDPPLESFLKKTTPVGKYPPNPWGLYDMHGNVWEWCLDPYMHDYPRQLGDDDIEDRNHEEDENEYVRRGGGWASSPVTCRSANRWKLPPDFPRSDSGFRVLLVISD